MSQRARAVCVAMWCDAQASRVVERGDAQGRAALPTVMVDKPYGFFTTKLTVAGSPMATFKQPWLP